MHPVMRLPQTWRYDGRQHPPHTCMPHAGYVAIIGKPNAGKSTLLNAILGQKLSIVTPKAQTTRHRIIGVHSGPGFQCILLDTPGILRPVSQPVSAQGACQTVLAGVGGFAEG